MKQENINEKIKNLQFVPPTPARSNQYDAAFVQSTPVRIVMVHSVVVLNSCYILFYRVDFLFVVAMVAVFLHLQHEQAKQLRTPKL